MKKECTITAVVIFGGLAAMCSLTAPARSQIIVPGDNASRVKKVAPVSLAVPVLRYEIVSKAVMDSWPVDKKRTGEKLWAENTWGGDSPNYRNLFNWNIWPNRVVFRVDARSDVARGEAYWRRSALSIRLKGLKILSAKTGEEIPDARLVEYTGEKVVVDFQPVSGPGDYYLYYCASEPVLFDPSQEWLKKADTSKPVQAKAEKIEARCQLDSFYPMETIPLKTEIEELLSKHPDTPYLVFPEDRDNSIKMQFDIPFTWIVRDPSAAFTLEADRNEYRVFQLGLWACRKGLDDVEVEFSSFKSDSGTIDKDCFQCLTLDTKIKSKYLKKPAEIFPVPKRQVRALWIGVDLPETAAQGTYTGTVVVKPANAPAAVVPVTIRVSGTVVEEKGDNDLWRLSRLRWLESDIGLSNEIFPPYTPLVFDARSRSISTWGHTLVLNEFGLPEQILAGVEDIMADPVSVSFGSDKNPHAWRNPGLDFTKVAGDRIEWRGRASSGKAILTVDASIEFDGCIDINLTIDSAGSLQVDNLTLTLAWRKEHAGLAAGMGYRGKRDRDGIWRSVTRRTHCFGPSLWMGSMKAGLGWITWDTAPWEDPSRMEAATVTGQEDRVRLQINLGNHGVSSKNPWKMEFALRPTPVKPVDKRHWQFRYLARGGGFSPSDIDTPQSYLKDNCKRLDELPALGVKRLNLHDWWGPCFNYPWQWDGPDNLSRLTEEAHKRGIRVKVYNSGRELSTLAPEFWGLVYIGSEYTFRNSIDPDPVGSYQDAWHESHLPDGLGQGWPRLHELGNEHAVPVSNATRNGNFYLESMRYMTEHFGTDGAYWDGADGPTLGHREMAKRLWTIFHKTNPEAVIDVHHGTTLSESTMSTYMLCLPFIDSIWHGEGFPYDRFDPWAWLVEISGLPFGIPSEMLSGEQYMERGMLFGIWPRMGWGAGTEKEAKLWSFFNIFGIENAEMLGWWEKKNGVTIDRPDVYVTAFRHPQNGVLLVLASWHPPLQQWVGSAIDVSLALDRNYLGLPAGPLAATDIISGEDLDITKPVVLSIPEKEEKSAFYEYRSLESAFQGRCLWVRGK